MIVFGRLVVEASGVRGLDGERDGGGGAGSGFSRLSCKLRPRACWRWDSDIEAEAAGSSAESALKTLTACLDDDRASLKGSSRVGMAFLIPR